MRSIIFILSFLFSFQTQAVLLNENGDLRPEVYKIIQKFSNNVTLTNHDDQVIMDKIVKGNFVSVEQANQLAQKIFLRPKGSERLSPEAFAFFKQLSAKLSSDDLNNVIELFKELGDINAVLPDKSFGAPSHIIIHGSLVTIMQEIVQFLSHLVDQKTLVLNESTKIVFIAGERALQEAEREKLSRIIDKSVNPAHKIAPNCPSDEREAAKVIWQHSVSSEALKKLPITFVGADKKVDTNRATTEDGVAHWVKSEKLAPGLFYVVSRNPFTFYQQRVTQLKMAEAGYKDGYIVMSMGEHAKVEDYQKHLDIAVGVLMDNLARTLYIEEKIDSVDRNNL